MFVFILLILLLSRATFRIMFNPFWVPFYTIRRPMYGPPIYGARPMMGPRGPRGFHGPHGPRF